MENRSDSLRLSRITHPRATLWAMILLALVFLSFGLFAQARTIAQASTFASANTFASASTFASARMPGQANTPGRVATPAQAGATVAEPNAPDNPDRQHWLPATPALSDLITGH